MAAPPLLASADGCTPAEPSALRRVSSTGTEIFSDCCDSDAENDAAQVHVELRKEPEPVKRKMQEVDPETEEGPPHAVLTRRL